MNMRSCLLFLTIALLRASNVGRDWGVERGSYLDPVTGVRIWEMAAGPGANDNLYFHFSNFSADNRNLIFKSNRTGSWQLFRVEVASGRIVQLTDDPQIPEYAACPDPTNARRLYYLSGSEIFAMDILDFTTRRIGTIPPPYIPGSQPQPFQPPTLSGDGKWVTVSKQRDEHNWEIGLMSTETGEYRTVITEGFRIGHVVHSPTDSTIFYVWESGDQGMVPQRSWLVNVDGSANRPFYFRLDPKAWFTPLKDWVTHEAWVADTGEMTMIMHKVGLILVQKDGTSRMVREGSYWHAAARRDGKFIVLDDFQGRIWLVETATGNTHLLATGIQDKVRTVHGHPSFDQLGRYVQFHSGRTHDTVAIIDLQELPAVSWTK